MTKEDKYFDDLLRDKLAGFAETPPAHVWEGIQQVQQAARRKKLFFYLKLTGAAAALIIAFLIGRQVTIQPDGELFQNEIVEVSLDSLEGIESKSESIASDQTSKLEDQNLLSDNDKQMQNRNISASSTEQLKNGANVNDSDPVQSASSKTDGYSLSESTNQNLLAGNNSQSESSSDIINQNQQPINHLNTLFQPQNKERAERENFSLLESLTNDLFSFRFKPEEEQLETITREDEPQSLTVEDLEAIERNRKMLASNENSKQKNPWQVAAMVSPNFAVNQSSYKESYARNMSNPGSKEDLSVGGGFAVSYKANKRLSVQSGVYFSKIGQTSSNQSNRQSEVQNSPVSDQASNYFNTTVEVKSGQTFLNASAGIVEFDNLPSNTRIGNSLEAENVNNAVFLTAAEFQQNFEYVEIPLNLRYLLIDSKIDINLLGGFSTNLLIGNDAYLESNLGRERVGETRDMNKVNYSTSFGIGFGYGISKKVSMHLEPQIKYFLGSLNSNPQVDFKPYTIGIYTGLSYRF